MHIVLISPTYSAEIDSPELLLERMSHTRELARSLAANAHRVTWLQAYDREARLVAHGVPVRLFRATPFGGGMHEFMREHIDATSLADALADTRPDAVHITGLHPRDILRIAGLCASTRPVLSASFHGGRPSEDTAYYTIQRQALSLLDVVLFNTPDRAGVWQDAGLIDAHTRIVQCPETSSCFRLLSREEARARTGMHGSPVCIASARLHPIKDPLTLVGGFARVLECLPDARLYWAYQSGELLEPVRGAIDGSASLRSAVVLLGAKPSADMEDLFNSADFFVQSSVQEYGGNSLAEAMACGAIPVVSDIPSFRELTGDDRFGTLFPVGDAPALARRIVDTPRELYPEHVRRIREHFEQTLSFDVIARTLSSALRVA